MHQAKTALRLGYLEDLWDEEIAGGLDEPELLRYRSNLLGRDLRITNFGGGNTSSKIVQADPLDGREQLVLWVKGSGGDLGSIQRDGFATLYLDKLRGLEQRYRGVEHESAFAAPPDRSNAHWRRRPGQEHARRRRPWRYTVP